MESDWSIEKITGIRVIENPDNGVLNSILEDNGRWQLLLITKGSLTYRRDNKDRKLGPGILVVPSPKGYEAMAADSAFRGRLLSIPSYHVISMNEGENVNLHMAAHKDPFRKLTSSDVTVLKNYYSLIADLAPVDCFTYSGPEMMHLTQALLMYLKKFYL